MSCTREPPAATLRTCVAAADRQDRQVRIHRAAREVDLELVAARLGIVDVRVPRLAVEDRVDVATAREHAAPSSSATSARGLSLTSSTRATAPDFSTDVT